MFQIWAKNKKIGNKEHATLGGPMVGFGPNGPWICRLLLGLVRCSLSVGFTTCVLCDPTWTHTVELFLTDVHVAVLLGVGAQHGHLCPLYLWRP